MASIVKSADVRPAASASALATENLAPKAAHEQLFCVSAPGTEGAKPPALPAFLPPSGLFAMAALGDHLGERFPDGASGLWEVGSTAKAGKPVLLQDRHGGLHVRLYEPRGTQSWAGVSTSATHSEVGEADGARILARLRWLDEDFKFAMAAIAAQLGSSVEITGDRIRFFGGLPEYERWCEALCTRARDFAQRFGAASVEVQ